MPVLVEEIFETYRKKYSLTLLAGESGLKNIARTVYIIEDIETSSFLKGGELAITTGLSTLHEPDWIRRLLPVLIEKNISGLIVNVGKYIFPEDITPEQKRLCDAHGLPLFIMPWDIYLSDITQEFWNQILTARQKNAEIVNAFKNVLFADPPSPDALSTLHLHGYADDDSYQTALMRVPELLTGDHPVMQKIEYTISFHFPEEVNRILYFSTDDLFLFVFHNVDGSAVRQILEAAYDCLPPSFAAGVRAGVSHKSPKDLKTGFKQAKAALQISEVRQRAFTWFSDLRSWQIYLSVSDQGLLRHYCFSKLEPLLQDQKMGPVYIDTLEQYLTHNGHLNRIAEAMNCHRNTVLYRTGKIRELLAVDLDDGGERFRLNMAVSMYRYLEIFPDYKAE